MRFAHAAVMVGTLLAAVSLPASAGDWGRYDNPRFAYAVNIPPGFSDIAEAANSDGGVSHSTDGNAELRVWGAYVVDRDFSADVADRIRSDASNGWEMSYDRRKAETASWSGSKDGRVFYARAMTDATAPRSISGSNMIARISRGMIRSSNGWPSRSAAPVERTAASILKKAEDICKLR